MGLPPAGANDRLNVFVANARADAGFAVQLSAFLREAGFRVLANGDDLASGPERVVNLMADADAVVLVLTDAALRSSACAWQAEEAERLGKRIVQVLPAPLAVKAAEADTIRFYVDPALPQSGFFDGQKQLINALYTELKTAREPMRLETDRGEVKTLQRELKNARNEIARIKREERAQRKSQMSQPPYPPLPSYDYMPPPRRRFRFPWLRGGFLLLVGGYVVAFLVNDDVRAGTRGLAAKAATWAEEVQQATEPPREHGAPAEDYAPTREASTGARGANVRSYPLPHATLLVDLPAHTALNVNGRINVQGQWWFRVVLPDGRTGFVQQNAIAWGHAIARPAPAPAPASTSAPPPAPATAAHIAGVTPVEPVVAAEAGRAGAKIRTSPARNARVIVRIGRGADVSVNGKRRLSGHWWYRVRLEDGREGYARDDVLTAPGGGRLRL